MRLSLTIPDKFYARIKDSLSLNGYTSINDYILDLLRKHQNGAVEIKREYKTEYPVHQIDAPPEKPSIEDLKQTIQTIETKELWGNPRLYCQICRESPALSRQYKYDDGSGEGEGMFCKRHTKELDEKEHVSTGTHYTAVSAKSADFTYFHPIPKPKKKEKKK